MLIHIIKAILTIMSYELAVFQFRNSNKRLGIYWCFVGLYWLVNLIQGLI